MWLGVVLLIALVRTLHLAGDPPASMPEANPMDEGLWADGARGLLLFSDWFADDTGNALVIAPLHSLLLAAVYQLFGIGLWQTRLVPALCGIGTCLLLGRFVGRRLGSRAGAVTALLLALCPLLDQHGRSGLLESEQLFWMCAAFATLAGNPVHRGRAFAAGLLLAAGVATKPNTGVLGAVPLLLVFLAEWRTAARAPRPMPGFHQRHLQAGLAAVAGGLLGALPLVLFVWLPHWQAWGEAVHAESGADQWHLGDHLLRLGLAFARELQPGVERLWAPLRHAPVLVLLAWGWLVARAGRGSQRAPGELAVAVWAAASVLLAEGAYMHVGRRQLLAVPALGLLGVYWACRWRREVPALQSPRLAWLLLLLPPLWWLRPYAANAAVWLAGADAAVGRATGLASLVLLPAAIGWLAPRLPDPLPIRRRFLTVLPALAAIAMAINLWQSPLLRPTGQSILDAQQALRGTVEDGEVVLGQHASLLFLDAPVRTVRRNCLDRFYASPRPNTDAFERLQPRYLLDYRDPELQEFHDLPTDGYVPVQDIDYLREHHGGWRYELQLRRRR